MAIFEEGLAEAVGETAGGGLLIGTGILLGPAAIRTIGRLLRPIAREVVKIGISAVETGREATVERGAAAKGVVEEMAFAGNAPSREVRKRGRPRKRV